MRKSSYLISVQLEAEKSQYMLIHGYTGAIDIVEEHIAKFLESSDSFSSKDIPFSQETKEALIKRGYITEKTQEEEYAYVARMASALHRKDKILNSSFTLVVTYNCNFRCPYCFEKGVTSLQSVFTHEMVDKMYNAILQIEPREQLRAKTITLYGGEPLLKENKEIIRYIIEKGKKLGFKFAAITNGYDLDSYEDMLSPDDIYHLQITIDGMKKLHNSRRVHYQGLPTFDKIINNIGMALKKGISINIRVNTDKNNFEELQTLKSLFDNLQYTGYKQFTITSALLRNYSENRISKQNFFSQKDFIEKHRKLNYKYGCQDYGIYRNLYNSIKNNKPLFFRSTFCGAQTNSYALDPFGKIYPCLEVVGATQHSIGDYSEETINWKNNTIQLWRNKNITNFAKCKHCKYALLCGSGCPAHNMNIHHCYKIDTIVQYTANRAYSNMR